MRVFSATLWFGISLCLFGLGPDAHAQNAPLIFVSKAKSDTVSVSNNAPVPLFSNRLSLKGVVFPQPYGASLNVYYGTQDLEIQNLKLGLNGEGLTSLDGLLEVESYTESAQTVSFQADAWVIPFLNVYGMVGVSSIKSEVKLAVPTDFELDIITRGSFLGYGATLAGVIGPVFISGDAMAVHAFARNQDNSDMSFTTGVRVGPVFNFKNKPKRNLVVWVGGLYTDYVNTSSGTYDAIDLFPQAQDDINREITNLDTWYNGLNASDQATYKAQYQDVRGLLSTVSGNVNDTEIDYSLDKRLEMPWNLVIGAQYQLGPKFLVKGEMQWVGSRTAALISMNYRFGNN